MKILVLIGSGRKDGNTTRVVELVQGHLEALAEQAGERLETEKLFLNDLDISSCRGCRLCFDRGEESCPLKDDIPEIRGKIDASDGLILASPVYVNDVSGRMKTLIDRLAYVCHRPAFAGKCALLIATVAGSTVNHTLRTLDIALRTWGVHISAKAGFTMGALMSREAAEQRFGQRAAKAAGRFFQDLRQKRYLKPSFLSLMVFRIQQLAWKKEPPEELDYQYWHDHGWFNRSCSFYIPHQANPFKVGLARFVGMVVSGFFR